MTIHRAEHASLAGGWTRAIAVGAALCCSIAFTIGRIHAWIAAAAVVGDSECSVGTVHQPGGHAKVVVRGGDFCDGRLILGALLDKLRAKDAKGSAFDINLEINAPRLAGFSGESLRDLELKMSSRGGEIYEFVLKAGLGTGGNLTGSLAAEGRQGIFLETDDAGALFRFINVYSRMRGGRLQLAMDAVVAPDYIQNGVIIVKGFAVAGEPAWEYGLHAKLDGAAERLISFSRLRIEFKLAKGEAIVSDGVLFGSELGATAHGKIDFAKGEIGLSGVVLPLQHLEPASFLTDPRGSEGLFTLSYTIRGSLQAPITQIDPAGPPALVILRKLFENKTDGTELSR